MKKKVSRLLLNICKKYVQLILDSRKLNAVQKDFRDLIGLLTYKYGAVRFHSEILPRIKYDASSIPHLKFEK